MKDDVLATWDGFLSLVGLVLSRFIENDPIRDSNGAGIQDARPMCQHHQHKWDPSCCDWDQGGPKPKKSNQKRFEHGSLRRLTRFWHTWYIWVQIRRSALAYSDANS